MKQKLIFSYFLAGLLCSMAGLASSAQAVDLKINRDTIEKFEKDIAKNKEEITEKSSEITTQQMKIEKDMAKYGQTSNEVRGDQEKLKDLRKDLADKKSDLYKNTIRKKVEAGEAIESDTTC